MPSPLPTLYRTRWGIETAFQKLEKYLNSEIETLGYPQAALFGFCLGLVAFNLYAVVMAALRAAHPTQDIDQHGIGVLSRGRDCHDDDGTEYRRVPSTNGRPSRTPARNSWRGTCSSWRNTWICVNF